MAEIEIAIFARGCLSRRVESMQALRERIAALDAAVTTGPAGDRALRLLSNRRRVAPQTLPKLLLTAHNNAEYQWAQDAAQRFSPLVDSVKVLMQSGRNETALNALAVRP